MKAKNGRTDSQTHKLTDRRARGQPDCLMPTMPLGGESIKKLRVEIRKDSREHRSVLFFI